MLNRAKVQHGETVAVIGIGGIGLNVHPGGPHLLGQSDHRHRHESRQGGQRPAVRCHRLHRRRPKVDDTVEAVKELLPNGVDYAFECVGHPALIDTAINLLDWGGSCVLLGVPKLGTEASFVINTLYNDKSILGCRYGSTRPHHDIPMYVDFYKRGLLLLDELVSQTYPLADVQRALDDLHDGKLNRGVLEIG